MMKKQTFMSVTCCTTEGIALLTLPPQTATPKKRTTKTRKPAKSVTCCTAERIALLTLPQQTVPAHQRLTVKSVTCCTAKDDMHWHARIEMIKEWWVGK